MPTPKSCNPYGDKVTSYSFGELVELYLQEGRPYDEAIALADRLVGELKILNNSTRNVWRRARHR